MTEPTTEQPTIKPNDPPAIDESRLAEIEARALATPTGERYVSDLHEDCLCCKVDDGPPVVLFEVNGPPPARKALLEWGLQGRQDTLDLVIALRQSVEKSKQAEAKCAALRQQTIRMLEHHKERTNELERDLNDIKMLMDEMARTGFAPISDKEPLH